MKSLLFALTILTAPQAALALENNQTGPNQTITFSVGPDETLTYPADLITLPDEHTTIFPLQHRSDGYRFFAASDISGGTAGTVVLETQDLRNFSFANGYDSP